ncbi:MAG: polysaccharide biosynthesis C-terminal domain-containing protein, partial [Lentisphaeria bacterium]|nr:polysaccharide biosynthesis C-terminal domain-containing protein [Lentisphaeria bacterium]
MSRTSSIIRDFTSGPLFWGMVKFSLPFMFSNALQVFYSMADMFIVGRYVGSHGMAAVSIASQATMLPTMVALGMTTGGQVYISQLIGAGKREKLNSAIGTLFSLILLMALLVTLLGMGLAGEFLRLLHTPEEAFAGAYHYLFICSAGMIFIFGYNMISAVLRGMGDAKHPFWFIIIASVVNVLLDLLFIAGFGMGPGGAGLATV